MKFKIGFLSSIILVVALSRLLPHPPNFTPIMAIALFGGTYFRSRLMAIAIPILAMIISDLGLSLIITEYEFFGWMRLLVYSNLVVMVLLGARLLKGKVKILNVTGLSVASSLLFFITTNFLVWLASPLYPLNPAGLVACYVAGIPYFYTTLLSTLLYGAIMFGGVELAKKKVPAFVFQNK